MVVYDIKSDKSTKSYRFRHQFEVEFRISVSIQIFSIVGAHLCVWGRQLKDNIQLEIW